MTHPYAAIYMCACMYVFFFFMYRQKVDLTKFVESHEFVFDRVYDENSSNTHIYDTCCRPLVQFAMNRGKATVFAFGQTGAGKVRYQSPQYNTTQHNTIQHASVSSVCICLTAVMDDDI